MALVLTDEQQLLQKTAQDFFSTNSPITAFRESRDQNQIVSYQQEIWQQMVTLGWSSILIPESLDGLDFGLTGMGLITIESAKTLCASPLQSTASLAVEALLRCRQSNSRDELLKAIAAGKEVPSFIQSHTLTLQSDKVHGEVEFVSEGMAASSLLAVIQNDDTSPTLCLIDLADHGVSREPISLIDQRDYARIKFTNAPAKLFEWHSDALEAQQEIDAVGAVITACELYGISSEAFARTLGYLKEREQFGQKIGAFQALQHRMAKVYMQSELLKSVLLDALDAVENQRDDYQLAVSHAKVLANDVAQLVCTEAIQMHGGMGITDELDIGLFYKRARVLRTVFGSTAYHKRRFAKLSNL